MVTSRVNRRGNRSKSSLSQKYKPVHPVERVEPAVREQRVLVARDPNHRHHPKVSDAQRSHIEGDCANSVQRGRAKGVSVTRLLCGEREPHRGRLCQQCTERESQGGECDKTPLWGMAHHSTHSTKCKAKNWKTHAAYVKCHESRYNSNLGQLNIVGNGAPFFTMRERERAPQPGLDGVATSKA